MPVYIDMRLNTRHRLFSVKVGQQIIFVKGDAGIIPLIAVLFRLLHVRGFHVII